VQLAMLPQSLDGGDAFAFLHCCQRHAREHAASVDVHCTSPAFAAVAALFRSGERQRSAQCVEKRRSRFDLYGAVAAAHSQPYLSWENVRPSRW
jgi:hypothetical protein